MKIKDNNYYQNLYVRLLNAYDLKRNNHYQLNLYETHSQFQKYDYKKIVYGWFNLDSNINDFVFQFRSEEEELLINLDLRGI